jgi:C1A family cysteine protease
METLNQKTGWKPDQLDSRDYEIDHSKIISVFDHALTKLLSVVGELINVLPPGLKDGLQANLLKRLDHLDPIQVLNQLLSQKVMLLPVVLVNSEASVLDANGSSRMLFPAPIEQLLKIREKASSEQEKECFDQNSLEVMRLFTPGIIRLADPTFKLADVCQTIQSSHSLKNWHNRDVLQVASIYKNKEKENIRDFIFLPMQGSVLDFNQPVTLPPAVDLTYYCSEEVKPQGDYETCCAHAGVALLEFFHNKKRLARKPEGEKVALSRRFLHTVSRMVGQETDGQGSSIRATMKAMKVFGVPPETFWQYGESEADFQEHPNAFCYTYAQNYQVLNYFRLDKQVNELGRSKSENLESLKQLRYRLLIQVKAFLAAGFPSMFGVYFPEGGFQADQTTGLIPYQSADQEFSDRRELGHAVVAVGYDDVRQAILIRNSWKNWGINGYGWLPYQFILEGKTADWWSIIDAEWFDESEFGLRSPEDIQLGAVDPKPPYS